MWTKRQIENHKEAAKKLGLIKDEVAEFLRGGKNVTEASAVAFVKSCYRKHGLVNDSKKEFAIVAFGKNTGEVHYFPKKRGDKLKNNSLVLLDMWGRLRSEALADQARHPYADMTWMFWYGKKIPKDIQGKWNVLKEARDTALEFIRRNELPRGLDVDRIAHDVVGDAGFGDAIKHTIGHSLGFDHPHGKLPGINWKEYLKLQRNIGYTIEPGMYFKGKYGMRTEIDFYIDSSGKIVITTPMQKKLEMI